MGAAAVVLFVFVATAAEPAVILFACDCLSFYAICFTGNNQPPKTFSETTLLFLLYKFPT